MNDQTPTFVGAIIRNQKGEFLLQKRDGKPVNFPHCWTLFGGKVDDSETPKEAITRELIEEISLIKEKITSLELVRGYTQENGSKQIIFEMVVKSTLKDLSLKEGEKMEFISRNNLFRRKFAFNIKEVLSDFLKRTHQTSL